MLTDKGQKSVKGVVLSEEDYGDSDKIITVLCREEGKISVYCRGAKSLKSRKFSSVQLFAYSDITVTSRAGKYYFSEAELIESFFGIREGLEAISLAMYVAEAALAVTVENENQDDILSLVLNTLYVIANTDKNLSLVKAVFELRLSVCLGLYPSLDACAVCEGESDFFYLDTVGGVLICSQCLMDGKGANDGTLSGAVLVPVSTPTLSVMRFIVSAPAKKIFSFTYDGDIGELSRATEEFFIAQTERSFQTLSFLKGVL